MADAAKGDLYMGFDLSTQQCKCTFPSFPSGTPGVGRHSPSWLAVLPRLYHINPRKLPLAIRRLARTSSLLSSSASC